MKFTDDWNDGQEVDLAFVIERVARESFHAGFEAGYEHDGQLLVEGPSLSEEAEAEFVKWAEWV